MRNSYLISYGSCSILGRFVPRYLTQAFQRGDRVVIRSERGKELGSVLMLAEELALPASLRHIPGEILGLAEKADEIQAQLLSEKSASTFVEAGSVISGLEIPLAIVDLETVIEPETCIVHIVRLGEVALQPVQDALTQRLHANILLHDVTDPAALENHSDGGCGSCGSAGGGCSSKGGCTNGTCGSGCGSKREFPDQWKAYFAGLREQMEERKKQTLLVE